MTSVLSPPRRRPPRRAPTACASAVRAHADYTCRRRCPVHAVSPRHGACAISVSGSTVRVFESYTAPRRVYTACRLNGTEHRRSTLAGNLVPAPSGSGSGRIPFRWAVQVQVRAERGGVVLRSCFVCSVVSVSGWSILDFTVRGGLVICFSHVPTPQKQLEL